jgi:hypothetical protein
MNLFRFKYSILFLRNFLKKELKKSKFFESQKKRVKKEKTLKT